MELVAAIANAGAASCGLRQEDSILLVDRYIRIRDVVDTSCIEPDIDESAIIAALPDGSMRFMLARADVANLVRRRIPKLAALGSKTDSERMTFERKARSDPDLPHRACFAAARDIPASELLLADSVIEADCAAGRPAAKLVYDRKENVVRAGQPIRQGGYLGRLMPLPPSGWDADEALRMKIRIGAVVIERDVRSLEPAADDESIFVKDTDGRVFRAPVSALSKKEARND